MTTTDTPLVLEKPTIVGVQPVDRRRRFTFAAYVVGASLGIATGVAILSGVGAFTDNYKNLIEMFVNGLVGIATALSLSYVAGSVIDYSLGTAFGKGKP